MTSCERLNRICGSFKDVLNKDGLDLTHILSTSIDLGICSTLSSGKKVRKNRRSANERSRAIRNDRQVFKQVGTSFDYVDLDGNKYYVI